MSAAPDPEPKSDPQPEASPGPAPEPDRSRGPIGAFEAARGALYDTPAALLTLVTLFWAGNAVAGRLAVDEIPPMLLVFLRWVVVALLVLPLFWREMRRHWPEARAHLGFIVVAGGLGFTSFNALFYVASHHTTAINLGILQGAVPVLVLVGAYLAYQTRITPAQILGVAITTAGVAVVASKGAPLALLEIGVNLGDAIMLLACLFYAGYTVALQRRPQIPGRVFFAYLVPVAVATAAPLALAEAVVYGPRAPTGEGWLLTLYVGLFPSLLAQLFFLRGVDLIGPGRAGVYVNLLPVFAAILSVLLLGERFAGYHGLALALVLFGIWLAQRAPRPGRRDA